MFYRKVRESVQGIVCVGGFMAIPEGESPRLFGGWTNSESFLQAREALEGGCKL
jgi:hypothetical protein